MMTRDEIRELAAFQADETKGACALSFYLQPDPPQDRSHRREAIVAKDVVSIASLIWPRACAVMLGERQSLLVQLRSSGGNMNSLHI
jgi:hypothetical protein